MTTKLETFNKIPYTFMIKTLRQQEIEGKFLNMIKGIYKKPTDNIILHGERLKDFCLRPGPRRGCLFSLSNTTHRYIPKRTESRDCDRYLHTNIQSSIIYNPQKVEIAQVSTIR